MLIEGNGRNASPSGTGLGSVPAIEGGISGDMQRKAIERSDAVEVERDKGGDVVFVKRLRVLGQHDITIVRGDSSCHARAVAPQVFLFFFEGAVGLLLVGAFFDAAFGNRDHLGAADLS